MVSLHSVYYDSAYRFRNIGKKYTQEQFNEGIRRLDIYKQWWLDSILEIKEADTLVVMQSEDVKPNYRDDKPPYVANLVQTRRKLTAIVTITFNQHGIIGGCRRSSEHPKL